MTYNWNKIKKPNGSILELTINMSMCNECNGRNYVKVGETDKKCNCLRNLEYGLLFYGSNIPIHYQTSNIDNIKKVVYQGKEKEIETCLFALDKYMSEIDKYFKNGIGLYLWSKEKGSGKTLASCVLANEFIVLGKTVRFITGNELIQKIKSTYEKDSEETELDVLEDFKKCDLLVIDDFGMDRTPSDWCNGKFYDIVNHRYVNKKATIYTSNQKIADLDYDERIKNRVMENIIEVHFPETSVRNLYGNARNNEFFKDMR